MPGQFKLNQNVPSNSCTVLGSPRSSNSKSPPWQRSNTHQHSRQSRMKKTLTAAPPWWAQLLAGCEPSPFIFISLRNYNLVLAQWLPAQSVQKLQHQMHRCISSLSKS
eukprot:4235402-Amphidinium_carterae.2